MRAGISRSILQSGITSDEGGCTLNNLVSRLPFHYVWRPVLRTVILGRDIGYVRLFRCRPLRLSCHRRMPEKPHPQSRCVFSVRIESVARCWFHQCESCGAKRRRQLERTTAGLSEATPNRLRDTYRRTSQRRKGLTSRKLLRQKWTRRSSAEFADDGRLLGGCQRKLTCKRPHTTSKQVNCQQ